MVVPTGCLGSRAEHTLVDSYISDASKMALNYVVQLNARRGPRQLRSLNFRTSYGPCEDTKYILSVITLTCLLSLAAKHSLVDSNILAVAQVSFYYVVEFDAGCWPLRERRLGKYQHSY